MEQGSGGSLAGNFLSTGGVSGCEYTHPDYGDPPPSTLDSPEIRKVAINEIVPWPIVRAQSYLACGGGIDMRLQTNAAWVTDSKDKPYQTGGGTASGPGDSNAGNAEYYNTRDLINQGGSEMSTCYKMNLDILNAWYYSINNTELAGSPDIYPDIYPDITIDGKTISYSDNPFEYKMHYFESILCAKTWGGVDSNDYYKFIGDISDEDPPQVIDFPTNWVFGYPVTPEIKSTWILNRDNLKIEFEKSLLFIPPAGICDKTKWLSLNNTPPNYDFNEIYWPAYGPQVGLVGSDNRNELQLAPLTGTGDPGSDFVFNAVYPVNTGVLAPGFLSSPPTSDEPNDRWVATKPWLNSDHIDNNSILKTITKARESHIPKSLSEVANSSWPRDDAPITSLAITYAFNGDPVPSDYDKTTTTWTSNVPPIMPAAMDFKWQVSDGKLDRKQTRDNWLGINYSNAEVAAQTTRSLRWMDAPTFTGCNYDNECSGLCIYSATTPDIWRWGSQDTNHFYKPQPTNYYSAPFPPATTAHHGRGICQMKQGSVMKILSDDPDVTAYGDTALSSQTTDLGAWGILRSGLGEHWAGDGINKSDYCKWPGVARSTLSAAGAQNTVADYICAY
jgi:hypothetical protein